MIVVIDTNVYISALVFGGAPQIAVGRAMTSPWQIATSRELREEIMATLTRRFGWPVERVISSLDFMWQQATWHQPLDVSASRDPKDNHVLGCAVAAQTNIILTGDKDLLVLHPFQGISILTPAAFLTADGRT